MDWSRAYAPTIDDIGTIAGGAYQRLPAVVRERLGDLAIFVEDLPDDDVVAQMGLDTPYGLLGLYCGVDLTRKSVLDVPSEPDAVLLYRRPILDLWSDGEDTLEDIVTHVLIHEIGHHLGLSDEAMERIEQDVREPHA